MNGWGNDPCASRPTVRAGEIDGRHQRLIPTECLADERRIDVGEHQLGSSEHGECAVVAPVDPCEIQESLATPAMNRWAAEVVCAVDRSDADVDTPLGLGCVGSDEIVRLLANLHAHVHVVDRYAGVAEMSTGKTMAVDDDLQLTRLAH